MARSVLVPPSRNGVQGPVADFFAQWASILNGKALARVEGYVTVLEKGAIGDGTSDDRGRIADADTDAVARGEGVQFAKGTFYIASNLTITSPVRMLKGAKLKPATGATVTINGAFEAGLYQCFDVSLGGTIAFGAVSVREVFPHWWGAAANDSTDDTDAIQAAIDTGKDVNFGRQGYRASGLTQSTDSQVLRGYHARISKNANGVILACSGDNVELHGVEFRGDASTPTFTGDNVTFSGDNCAMWGCGSRWAHGRAVKATGQHFQIYGAGDIYQTADATSTGYDIEIGVSGTATLYHELVSVRTSQATGGILLIDTGSHSISGGQCGKLTVESGTSPSGVNGGKTLGARILGDVTVELSNAIFAGCQFSAVDIVFASGTSGCRLDTSNDFAVGHTITNNGNKNNFIARQVSTGSVIQVKYGDDSSLVVVEFAPSSGIVEFPENVNVKNNKNLVFESSTGTSCGTMSAGTGNNFNLNSLIEHLVVTVPNNKALQVFANSVLKLRVGSTGIGFFGAAEAAKPEVTGSRAGNAALASALTALATLGLITDSTTA